ncbi:alpha/beta fold hydrolase [Helicobacter cappadocius]|uniref:Alpha/beta fold hydrolase n=1 Tax=Helicobacter cappadocius TaxID=3063998 RepID=A0AA90TAU2_9HELI|nr:MULTISPECIES: alpha/beta fold hydrolase [unclassified Helicobacter]MDO7252339.1 alpha/beta fold hydrolase [Helicobacter sp. faydin-H75]MDP2538206.1 alpha/beta fold hydrolase [Helicobacter sp. faydin-H76]
MKIIKNSSFRSDFGDVYYDEYIPDCTNGVVIAIAHGMIEHKDRYEWLCTSLAKKGYNVFINDHRGHGESIGGNIVWGEMGENGFEKAVDDMLTFHNLIMQKFPFHRFVLLGHSMGSLLSRRFLQLYEDKLDALILTGTPSPNKMLGFGVVLFRILEKMGVKGSPKISDLFSFKSQFKRKVPQKDRFKTHWACSDEEIIKLRYKDPKCQFRFTLNSFANLFEGMKKVFSTYPHSPQKRHLPVLFLSGQEDICGEYGKGVEKSYHHIKSQGYEDVTLKLYANARHEVFNEPNKLEVLDDMLVWLHKQGF